MENALSNVRLFIKISYRGDTILHNKGDVYENEEITQDKMPVDRADRRNGDQQHDRSGHRLRRQKSIHAQPCRCQSGQKSGPSTEKQQKTCEMVCYRRQKKYQTVRQKEKERCHQGSKKGLCKGAGKDW